MIKKENLIAVGAEKLAEILISLYENNPDLKKLLERTFASLEDSPKKIASMLRKEIASLKRSKKFIDYQEARPFTKKLEQLRISINKDLAPKSPEEAMSMMLDFLDVHESVFERIDDSNGSVSDVFKDACKDLGLICEKFSKFCISDAVELVFSKYMSDEYGIYDDLIPHFSNTLKEEGLAALQEKFESILNKENQFKVISALEDIADCRKDVDAYIRACSLMGKPSPNDHLEIAKRLIGKWRPEEALEWLSNMQIDSLLEDHPWRYDQCKLRIEALELNGEYEKAQSERIAWFEKKLCAEIYREILKHTKLELKESFKKNSIKQAFLYPEPHAALLFLSEIQEYEEAAKFILLRAGELKGRQYYLIRPIADSLREVNPLASTLLYRKLVEPVLEDAKSKYYNYAAKDLVMCAVLSKNISNWDKHENHTIYFSKILEKNKRKTAFWEEYKEAKEKQNKKLSSPI